jgi:hypothetical protein
MSIIFCKYKRGHVLPDFLHQLVIALFYVTLVMLFFKGRKRTLADNTVYQNGSIDTTLHPLLFSLDSTWYPLMILDNFTGIFVKLGSLIL